MLRVIRTLFCPSILDVRSIGFEMSIVDSVKYFITHPVLFVYQILQWILDKILSPTPPPPGAQLSRPKIAVIGAGLTGVSAASHCVGHGFECAIFEAGDRKALGGIWAKVCFQG